MSAAAGARPVASNQGRIELAALLLAAWRDPDIRAVLDVADAQLADPDGAIDPRDGLRHSPIADAAEDSALACLIKWLGSPTLADQWGAVTADIAATLAAARSPRLRVAA